MYHAYDVCIKAKYIHNFSKTMVAKNALLIHRDVCVTVCIIIVKNAKELKLITTYCKFNFRN